MRRLSTPFLLLFALYVTGASAQSYPPKWIAMCETWPGHHVKPTYVGNCEVSFKETAPGEAEVLIDMHAQPLVELALGPGRCTLNGAPCLQIPASRPDGVRYQFQGARALEFTRPTE